MRENLLPEAELITSIISNTECMSIEQMQQLCRKTTMNVPKTAVFLCRQNYFKLIEDKYAHAIGKKFSYSKIDCLWVMFDLIQDEDGNLEEEALYSIIHGNPLVDFTYIQDSSYTVNMVYVDSTNINKLMPLQQKFYDYTSSLKGDEKKFRWLHMFVVRDLETVDMIEEMQLKMPHNIALLSGELGEKPEIKYLKK